MSFEFAWGMHVLLVRTCASVWSYGRLELTRSCQAKDGPHCQQGLSTLEMIVGVRLLLSKQWDRRARPELTSYLWIDVA